MLLSVSWSYTDRKSHRILAQDDQQWRSSHADLLGAPIVVLQLQCTLASQFAGENILLLVERRLKRNSPVSLYLQVPHPTLYSDLLPVMKIFPDLFSQKLLDNWIALWAISKVGEAVFSRRLRNAVQMGTVKLLWRWSVKSSVVACHSFRVITAASTDEPLSGAYAIAVPYYSNLFRSILNLGARADSL